MSFAGVSHAEGWWSGDWYITLGGTGFVAPEYEGSDKNELKFSPIVSIGKGGGRARFSSRNDSASIALLETESIRAGIAGKLVMPRDADTSSDLKHLKPVKLGAEIGGFVDVYPVEGLRVRAEVRQGIRSHDGMVADLAADGYTDLTPDLRFSAGPRVTWASNGYKDAYYKVTAQQSAASGIGAYDPGGGLHSAGVGAALTWKPIENVELSSFAEYKRLLGSSGDSTLVRERGSRNQLMFGISASYRFGFTVQ